MYVPPRVQVLPLPDYQVAFLVDGAERIRWHYARHYPRPFLYPVLDPQGVPITRMGHPAAPNHEHHRSVWFGHANVGGVNFWADGFGSQQVRQLTWLHYQDGESTGLVFVRLGWFDAHNVELLRQDLIVACTDVGNGEMLLELQSEFQSPGGELVLGKTNFGFLGVRVAAGVSALFGGGAIRASDGSTGEKSIFGRRYPWVDYSGYPRGYLASGISYFDHPDNPRHPTSWHVRDDGWMCASLCMNDPLVIRKGATLRLRYGLYVHAEQYPKERITAVWERFASLGAWVNVGKRGPYRVWLERRR